MIRTYGCAGRDDRVILGVPVLIHHGQKPLRLQNGDLASATTPSPATTQRLPLARERSFLIAWTVLGVVGLLSLTGCHDGPLYALKTVNPYYTLREWKDDRALGVTDHERRQELTTLASRIGNLPTERQQFWARNLSQIMQNDPNPEMRRIAMLAAGRLKTSDALQLLEMGLDDENMKVRMESCRGLGKRAEPQAAQLLASTFGTETDQDVRNAAVTALGNHKGNVALDSLRLALDEQDPATTDLAMKSLRGVTGKNLGATPAQWIAALDRSAPGNNTPGNNDPGKIGPASPASDDPTVRVASGESTELR